MAEVRRCLHSAELQELPPGAPYRQASHAVLLKGELRGQGHRSSSAQHAVAPVVLPWLQRGASGSGAATEERWQAGGHGALLLVCARPAEQGAQAS